MLFAGDADENAFAINKRLSATCGYEAAILIGYTLARRVFRYYGRNWVSVLAFIIAHESGHIRQFQAARPPKGVKAELHADFLGGWTLARITRGTWAAEALSAVFNEIQSTGAGVTGTPTYHGTATQRLTAVKAGYELALSGAGNADSAFGRGLTHVGL